jgi:uncharacterized protein
MNSGEPDKEIVLFLPSTGPSEEQVVEVIKIVLGRHPEIQFAWIYGSFTRHEAFQDIDLALYISRMICDMDPYALYKLQMQVAREVEEKIISPVPVDVRVLNDAPVEFQYEVIKTGRLVYERNREQRTDYEADIISRYLDLRYLFDRMDQAFLARVAR